MNVYIIQCSSGEYDSHVEWNVRAYLDKKKAEAFRDICQSYVEKNNELRKEYIQACDKHKKISDEVALGYTQRIKELQDEARKATSISDLILYDQFFSVEEMEICEE